jgi:spermidine/putrescine transport system permease protein
MERTGKNGKGWGLVAPAILWLGAFFVLPFALMIGLSLSRFENRIVVADYGLQNYIRFFTEPSLRQGLFVSLEITALVTVISVLLAYPLAWIIAFQVPRRWQRMVLVLTILPFWTSYVVRSYAWLLVLGQGGVINRSLMGLGVIDAPLILSATRFATVTGFVHFFVMLLTLTIYANLVQLSPNYARAAADLGAGRFATFRHVILPLTLPGVMTGAFLTFVLCMGDYLTPQILGGNNELTLPQLIMMQLGRRGDFPMASAMAIILMAVVTLAYVACARFLRLERV